MGHGAIKPVTFFPNRSNLSEPVIMSPGTVIDGDVDALSGLATRRRLLEHLNILLIDMMGGATAPSLILIGLNRFKAVNDSLGPLAGDELLFRVAQRLRSQVPHSTLIARASGDEFAVVLPNTKEAESTAIRLLEFLGRPYIVLGQAVTVGASLGVACADPTNETALDLLHAADIALHQSERLGRNQICHFQPTMRDRARSKHLLERDFRGAIAMEHIELQRALISQQFELHYQPLMSLSDGRLMGFEALARWRHPERGLVSPMDFIPLAEEIGLIDLLGEWVLRTACKDAQSWPKPLLGPALRIAVNVSPVQLRAGNALLAAIQRALAESGLAVERLELELTETALTQDIGDTLMEIRRMEFRSHWTTSGPGTRPLDACAIIPSAASRSIARLPRTSAGRRIRTGFWPESG